MPRIDETPLTFQRQEMTGAEDFAAFTGSDGREYVVVMQTRGGDRVFLRVLSTSRWKLLERHIPAVRTPREGTVPRVDPGPVEWQLWVRDPA